MPGPAPKNPIVRQRRNKSASRATLPAELSPRVRAPMLPKHIEWHEMTRRWWRDVWVSPMAGEYLRADEHGLLRLAILINMFWLEPSPKLAAEIRIQQQAYGLTPLDRRRLEWQVEQVEQARDKRERRRVVSAFVVSGDDPRDVLK